MLGRALAKGFSWSGSGARDLLTGGVTTVAGTRVAPSTAMAAAAVYSATSLIAETVASLPVRFVERDDEARRPVQPEAGRALWDRPNPYQTTTSFIESVVLSMLLWGEAFVFPRRRNSGLVFELWPLDPDRIEEVEPIRVGDDVAGVRFRVQDFETLENRAGAPVQMIHIPLLTLPGRLRGISPIREQAELIGMTLSSQEHASRFLGEGVHLTGVIENEANLTRDQAKTLVDTFNLMHAGPKRAGRVGVLTGKSTFRPLTIPPAELQFLEQMQYTDRKIVSLYRVPPHLVGDVERSTSWGSGIEEQTINFVVYRLLSLIRLLEEGLAGAMLAGTALQLKLMLNGLLRGSTAVRQAFYRDLWMIGALSQDEIRSFEDLPPLPGGLGRRYYVPANMMAVDAPAEELEQRFRLWLATRGSEPGA